MSLMILNLFIAVVLEGFTDSMNDAKRCINTDSYEKFRELWAIFDMNKNPDPMKPVQFWLNIEDASQLM